MVSVSLKNLTKRFDNVLALERVNLEIEKGEFFFILGPSGCGKSTLLRIIAGLYHPDGGQVFFDGRDVTEWPPNERNAGMVFQNYALWPHMTVWENVEYGLKMRKISLEERFQRVGRALKMVQMEGYKDRSPNQLSGGQQQRVALARALVIEPDVVLLDEPLSNLDSRLRLEMREQIQALQQEIGITMIYVTHDQKEALSMGDRVAVMEMGRVAQIASPRSLYMHPSDQFVADFIGEINLIPGKVSEVSFDEVIVKTALGEIYGGMTFKGIQRGDSVFCSVRPEALKFFDGDFTLGENILSGRIKSVVYLGEVEQYTVELADGTKVKLIEFDPLEQKAYPGEDVRIRVSPSRVVLLRDEGESPNV